MTTLTADKIAKHREIHCDEMAARGDNGTELKTNSLNREKLFVAFINLDKA